ncbi:MAG: gliding motility-associated C-terminal domain-containing protein [Chitinophagaceae bacterium]|nr:gliding motility-associated C-terminal domain-containing protein [Chitinophagaceae bacterium]
MRKIAFICLIFCLLISPEDLYAQSCFNVAAGNDTTISCLQACLDLHARVPDVRTTDDYQVVSIPYNPFPFTNPGGIPVDPSYIDDQFSPTINLPFTFCYYGQNYNACTIGTNGVLTFDLTNSGGYNDWVIPAGDLIPSATYPRAVIMGPFHDIDPDPNTTSPQWPGRKMEYLVVGTAPCRKFIVNFYRIPYWSCGSTNLADFVTQQMVLYEGTGIIDLFIENKPIACAANTNNGRAIMGIQNWNQNLGRAVPGRNNAVWASGNEGWRFVPNGATSLLNRVELYKNGVLVSTGTTTPLGNGELDVLFPNICQPEDSMSYAVRAFYQKCDDINIETEGSDTMIVYKIINPILTRVDSARCNGGLGKITVTDPLGPNLEYSIDGVNWQSSPVFNVPAGNYTVRVRIVASFCSGSTNVNIYEPSAITAVINVTPATCANNTGIIDIIAAGGTPTYQYSINGGATYQPGNSFSGLPAGIYNNIIVKDLYGCLLNLNTVISLNDTMRLELGPDSTICFGKSIVLLPQTNSQTDTFKWTPRTGLDYDTARNPVATPQDTIKYYLTAKWGICSRIDSITINVLHKPVVFAGNDTTICNKTNAFLHGIATNLSGTVNYAWTPPDSLNTPNLPNTVARMDTTRQFTLTVTDNYGCSFSVSDSMWVIMKPVVPAFAGNDTIAMLNKPHTLLGSGGVSYRWSPAGPLDNPFIQFPKAVLNNDTYFTVLVTDEIGCTAEDGVFVKVYVGPQYHVPNAFTPNGDGLNDVFRPIPSGIRSTAYFRVFNRNGQLVFQTSEWLKGWDGKFKGKDADQGTYIWIIRGQDVNGSEVEVKGTVILLR